VRQDPDARALMKDRKHKTAEDEFEEAIMGMGEEHEDDMDEVIMAPGDQPDPAHDAQQAQIGKALEPGGAIDSALKNNLTGTSNDNMPKKEDADMDSMKKMAGIADESMEEAEEETEESKPEHWNESQQLMRKLAGLN
jgi:hypothetical protein